MSFLVGLVAGSSCTLMLWGICQWFALSGKERQAIREIQAARILTIVDERGMNGAGLTCVVAQWLITGFVVLLLARGPGLGWRSGDAPLVLAWLGSVVMLGLLGAICGVRRKRTIYSSDIRS